MVIPNSIGTVFGMQFLRSDCRRKRGELLSGELLELSAFLVIVWHMYRIKSSPELSELIRAIVTGATLYFLAMIALQAYVLSSLIFMQV